MEDLSSRTAQEVLDDHLNLAENWGGERGFESGLEEDLRRNTSEDIVILINRGAFRGHEGVRQLAHMLREELPEHRSFEYTYTAIEGRMAFLEWAYEDYNVRVRDGADSYLIEKGKIVAQTIHYTVEQNSTRVLRPKSTSLLRPANSGELRRTPLWRSSQNSTSTKFVNKGKKTKGRGSEGRRPSWVAVGSYPLEGGRVASLAVYLVA